MPRILSDKNDFLRGFVNHEFLGFMGVIVTITLASAGNLFLELVRFEKEAGEPIFVKSKRDVKHSAFTLIVMLLATLLVVTIKPLVIFSQTSEAFVNGAALSIILFSILVLWDLTIAAFKLDPYG
jgi:hypothetical protein